MCNYYFYLLFFQSVKSRMGTITPNGTPLNVQIYAIFLKDRAFTLFLLKDSRFARTCALTVRVFKAPNATSNGGDASRVGHQGKSSQTKVY